MGVEPTQERVAPPTGFKARPPYRGRFPSTTSAASALVEAGCRRERDAHHRTPCEADAIDELEYVDGTFATVPIRSRKSPARIAPCVCSISSARRRPAHWEPCCARIAIEAFQARRLRALQLHGKTRGKRGQRELPWRGAGGDRVTLPRKHRSGRDGDAGTAETLEQRANCLCTQRAVDRRKSAKSGRCAARATAFIVGA